MPLSTIFHKTFYQDQHFRLVDQHLVKYANFTLCDLNFIYTGFLFGQVFPIFTNSDLWID